MTDGSAIIICDFKNAEEVIMKHYDYILVGAGLYSAVIAWHAKQAVKRLKELMFTNMVLIFSIQVIARYGIL